MGSHSFGAQPCYRNGSISVTVLCTLLSPHLHQNKGALDTPTRLTSHHRPCSSPKWGRDFFAESTPRSRRKKAKEVAPKPPPDGQTIRSLARILCVSLASTRDQFDNGRRGRALADWPRLSHETFCWRRFREDLPESAEIGLEPWMIRSLEQNLGCLPVQDAMKREIFLLGAERKC